MPNLFNPYAEWLGFSPGESSASYYRLFGLDDFETDTEKIATAAESVQTTLCEVSPDPHFAAWQKLLKQMETAEECLTDPVAKAAYDSALQLSPRRDAPIPQAIPVEQPNRYERSREELAVLPQIKTRRTRHKNRRSRHSVGWALAVLASVGALGAAAILYFAKTPVDESVAASSSEKVVVSEPNAVRNDTMTTVSGDLPLENGEVKDKVPLSDPLITTSKGTTSTGTTSTGDDTSPVPTVTRPVAAQAPDSDDRLPTESEIRAFHAAVNDVLLLLGERQLDEANARIRAANQLAATTAIPGWRRIALVPGQECS